MSRLYGSVQGDDRSEATRTAHRAITAHPRGWDLGIRTYGYPSPTAPDRDTFDVYISGGSHGSRSDVPLATVEQTAEGTIRVTLAPPFGGQTVELGTPVTV